MKYILVIICLFTSSLCKSQKLDSQKLIGRWISIDKQDSVIFSFEDSAKFSFKSSSQTYLFQSSRGNYKLDITKHPPTVIITTVDEAGISSINKWIVEYVDENNLTLESDMDSSFNLNLQKLKK